MLLPWYEETVWPCPKERRISVLVAESAFVIARAAESTGQAELWLWAFLPPG